MPKTMLITGATDGIGLETARMLAPLGHRLLLHGRSPQKLDDVKQEIAALADGATIDTFVADLSRMTDVDALADAVASAHPRLDVLINNAGVYKTSAPVTPEGLDLRFVVNTLAPYRLARRLLPLMDGSGRIVNLSSAAQSPVDLDALAGHKRLAEFAAYGQSKLAITMWSRVMAEELADAGPAVIAVNPGSLLASKMVKEGFGVAGNDIRIGADILRRAALDDAFADASGTYFDNDAGRFAPPHPDALDAEKSKAVVAGIEAVLADLAG